MTEDKLYEVLDTLRSILGTQHDVRILLVPLEIFSTN